VDAAIRRRGFGVARRTTLGSADNRNADVILLDTVGELASAFAFASVVFMGGTLVPHGGHNILEPARDAKPVVYGPHMENFREMSALFLAERGAVQIAGPEKLSGAVGGLLENRAFAAELGANAGRIVERHAGATDRVIAFLESLKL
jgi:3-deoxy-D-manno-octulosonic-acid transferase